MRCVGGGRAARVSRGMGAVARNVCGAARRATRRRSNVRHVPVCLWRLRSVRRVRAVPGRVNRRVVESDVLLSVADWLEKTCGG